MYVFTRQGRIRRGSDMEWVAAITERARAVTDRSIDVWTSMWSPAVGLISWTVTVDSLDSLRDFGERLDADDSFRELADKGAETMPGGVDDSLIEFLSGTPDPSKPVTVASVAVAVAAGGHAEAAIKAGIDIAETATAITEQAVLFGRMVTGPFGQVTWMVGYPDVAALEASQHALASDPAWLKTIDSTEGVFVEQPAFTHQSLARKVM